MLFITGQLGFNFYYIFVFPAFIFFLFLEYINVYVDERGYMLIENFFTLITKKREEIPLSEVIKFVAIQNNPTLDLFFTLRNNNQIIVPINLNSYQLRIIKRFLAKNYPKIQIF